MRPGSLSRVQLSPTAGSGEVRFPTYYCLRQLLLDVGDDALAGGDAGLHGLLDAAGDRRDLLRHDVVPAVDLTPDGVGLALDAALAATDQELGAGARLAGLRLATALEATQGHTATRGERLGDGGRAAGDAVTRLQHGADVDQPGALGGVAALLGRRLGGGGVGLGGLARLVLCAAAGAAPGRLRRRLGSRRARGAAGRAAAGRARVALASGSGLLGGGAALRSRRVVGGAVASGGGHGGCQPLLRSFQ